MQEIGLPNMVMKAAKKVTRTIRKEKKVRFKTGCCHVLNLKLQLCSFYFSTLKSIRFRNAKDKYENLF